MVAFVAFGQIGLSVESEAGGNMGREASRPGFINLFVRAPVS